MPSEQQRPLADDELSLRHEKFAIHEDAYGLAAFVLLIIGLIWALLGA